MHSLPDASGRYHCRGEEFTNFERRIPFSYRKNSTKQVETCIITVDDVYERDLLK